MIVIPKNQDNQLKISDILRAELHQVARRLNLQFYLFPVYELWKTSINNIEKSLK